MPCGTFRLVEFDEGAVQGMQENRRLVCVTDSGSKLAIWGQEIPTRNMQNIDSVLEAGLPCVVECEYRNPAEWADCYGHTHWVPQDCSLRVIQTFAAAVTGNP
jgi:hypothetical protein